MIWGVGYGAITQIIKETGNLVKNGTPNVTAYGDFIPLNGWITESGTLGVNTLCYFDTPIAKGKYTQMIISNAVTLNSPAYIYAGTKVKGTDLYKQSLSTYTTYKEIKIDLSDYPETFYFSFGLSSTASTYKFHVDNITLI